MNEHEITEALRNQAVGVGAPTLTLDDVRGRARSIRRRRTAIAGTGAAALVAAAVLPVALLVGNDSSRDALPPADATPTATDTANPVPDPPAEPVDQRGSYVIGDEIHPAEGEPFTPDVDGDLTSVRGLADGTWAMSVFAGGSVDVVLTDSSGTVLESHDALDGYLAFDDAATAMAWIGPDARVRVHVTGEEDPLTLPVDLENRRSAPEPVEVLPGCSAEECVVLVTVHDADPFGSSPVAVTTAGEVQSLDDTGLLSIVDVSPDGALASGIIDFDPNGQEFCSAVVVLATGEELWRDCDVRPVGFSPDGSSVLAIDAMAEGFGHAFVEVLDALDGTVLGRYEGGTVFDQTWASAQTYLVSMQTNTGENLVLEVEVAPRPGAEPEVVARGGVTPGDPSPLRLTGG